MITKDELLNMASDDKFLPGIYNYCDRWCERCEFTDRCLNYSMFEELTEGKDADELSIEDSLQIVKEIFELTHQMITDFAEKEGIDLSQIDDEKEYDFEEEFRKVEEHPLSLKAARYFWLVHNWLESRNEFIKTKFQEYVNLTEMGLDEAVQFKNASKLKDALETIRWYYTFIRVKINRAIHTKYFDNLVDDEEFINEQINISAKLALIGCGNSLQAWSFLYEVLEEDEDEFLKILAYLKKLSGEIKKEFPTAESYKRPYFDKPPETG